MPPPGPPPDTPYSDSEEYCHQRSPTSYSFSQYEGTSYDYFPGEDMASTPLAARTHGGGPYANQYANECDYDPPDGGRIESDDLNGESDYNLGYNSAPYEDHSTAFFPDEAADLSAYFSSAVIGSSTSSDIYSLSTQPMRSGNDTDSYHDEFSLAYELDEAGEPRRSDADYRVASYRAPRREGTCDSIQNKLDML